MTNMHRNFLKNHLPGRGWARSEIRELQFMVLADGRTYIALLTAWMKNEQQWTILGHCPLSTAIPLLNFIVTSVFDILLNQTGNVFSLESDLRRKTWNFLESQGQEAFFFVNFIRTIITVSELRVISSLPPYIL